MNTTLHLIDDRPVVVTDAGTFPVIPNVYQDILTTDCEPLLKLSDVQEWCKTNSMPFGILESNLRFYYKEENMHTQNVLSAFSKYTRSKKKYYDNSEGFKRRVILFALLTNTKHNIAQGINSWSMKDPSEFDAPGAAIFNYLTIGCGELYKTALNYVKLDPLLPIVNSIDDYIMNDWSALIRKDTL